MDLYDILACPSCKVALNRQDDTLQCTHCQQVYPIINGVPVVFPDGRVPFVQHEQELVVPHEYAPWVHRVVLQSLPPDAIALDLGSGNMALDLPHVVRMDVTLTPYVDVVGDAHALPFLPGTFDFIFSLAVIEHLRQPFVAAQQMYDALKPGGYVYGECNFVFAYHGYPHHYFNASQQGLEQVFTPFTRLRCSVAPYQMPSFALRSILLTYLRDLRVAQFPELRRLDRLIGRLLGLPLTRYDSYFSEQAALTTAAGVFFFGVKDDAGDSVVVPPVVRAAWTQSAALQERFPQPLDLGHADNLMRWALTEGRDELPEIGAYFDSCMPFRKHAHEQEDNLRAFAAWPVVEPRFGNADLPEQEPTDDEAHLHAYARTLEQQLSIKNEHIRRLEAQIQHLESGRVMRLLRMVRRS